MHEYLYESQKGESKAIKKRQTELHNAAVKAIVVDGRCFGDFRRPGMQHFLAVALPGYRGTHRRSVGKKMSHNYENYVPTISKALETVDSMSLTTDIWTNSK